MPPAVSTTVPPRYGAVAQALHWALAVIILTLAGLGIWLESMPRGPFKGWLLDLHSAFGVLALVLIMARIAWRLTHPAPPLPADTPAMVRLASRISHGTLYMLMAAIPVAGIATMLLRGRGINFGVFEVPPLMAADRGMAKSVEGIHTTMAWILLALVVAHVAAALWHHFVRRDAVLRRMLPAR